MISDHFDLAALFIGIWSYDDVNKFTYLAEKFTDKSSNPVTMFTIPSLLWHLMQNVSVNLFDGFSLKLIEGGSRPAS